MGYHFRDAVRMTLQDILDLQVWPRMPLFRRERSPL